MRLRVFSLSAYLSRSAQATSSSRVTPRVRTSLYTLTFSSPFPAEDVLVTQVAWVGERELVVKATDGIARVERVAYFNLGEVDAEGEEEERSVVGRLIRETDWEAVDGGWAEPVRRALLHGPIEVCTSCSFTDVVNCPLQSQNIVGIASTVSLASSSSALAGASAPIPSYPSGYLDVLPDAAGYNHIAYFSPPDAKEPVWLTSGAWEIDGGIERVDVQRGLVCVAARKFSSSIFGSLLISLPVFAQLLHRRQPHCRATPLLDSAPVFSRRLVRPPQRLKTPSRADQT